MTTNEERIIRDLEREVEELKKDIELAKSEAGEVRSEYQRMFVMICPQLPDEMRVRARAVWEAALYAHERSSAPGESGPVAVVARALTDAEKIGPRKLKGGPTDPVSFVAERIVSIAAANGREPMAMFEELSRRMEALHGGEDPPEDEEVGDDGDE